MRLKKLIEWANEFQPHVYIEREGKKILVFDVQTSNPSRFDTIKDAAIYLGVTFSEVCC